MYLMQIHPGIKAFIVTFKTNEIEDNSKTTHMMIIRIPLKWINRSSEIVAKIHLDYVSFQTKLHNKIEQELQCHMLTTPTTHVSFVEIKKKVYTII